MELIRPLRVFQKRNYQLFGNIEDDLITGGKDGTEHNGILEQVLDRSSANNVAVQPQQIPVPAS